MDKKQFIDMISAPTRFSSQDRGWLKAQLAKYPYSSVVATLALLADHAHGFDTPEERRAVALSISNPEVLDTLLANASSGPAVAPVADDPSFDILSEINTFQEVSFKTAPKSVILSNFLQVDPSEEEIEASQDARNRDINDKKSLTPDVSLGTETLAVILEKQGRYDKALAIYKNLLAHNPEKSSIFAPRIQRLTTILNSK
ncbi:MAG: tetratricopeptide repeat protein [Bacteroidales bacterium]|nr:tetratricopeptide repeat protein [Bacteroidales bacterium]